MMPAPGSTKVLDHGYVTDIEHWGSDERIIEAARMSTNKGFQGWGPKHDSGCMALAGEIAGQCSCNPMAGDEKLLGYLYMNKHSTPFEMAGLVIEVQAPIFVFREWQRHRTQSFNEMSARYTSLPNVNYIPSMSRLMMNAGGTNKQAGTIVGSAALTLTMASEFQVDLRETYNTAERLYQNALRSGVPKELARIHLPVGRYSRMRASANLRNWLSFLTLRKADGAQWEIRQYADAVHALLKPLFPRTMELFDNE